jgi:hypothetical protein
MHLAQGISARRREAAGMTVNRAGTLARFPYQSAGTLSGVGEIQLLLDPLKPVRMVIDGNGNKPIADRQFVEPFVEIIERLIDRYHSAGNRPDSVREHLLLGMDVGAHGLLLGLYVEHQFVNQFVRDFAHTPL